MFLSAVSLCLVLGKSSGFDLNEHELRAWKKIQPSVVYLIKGQEVSGTATLIDRDGLFLADRSAFTGKSVDGRTSDGSAIHLVWVATDDPTQFVLLKAEDWDASKSTPISIGDSDQSKRAPLLAVTINGPVRAEKWTNTYGVISPSRRFMPLSEIRLENTQSSLAGALLFNLDGELVGALNATLEMPAGQNNFQSRGGGGGASQLANGDSKIGYGNTQSQQYGPGVMTTAYTIGSRVLRRVVEGFRSPSHQVQYPTLGIVCRNAIPAGALIDSVKADSTADKAGLKKGDVITKMNDQVIQNQFDFARVMLDIEVGATLRMWVRRENGLVQMLDVQVGN